MICVFAVLPQSSCVSQGGAHNLLMSVCFSPCCGKMCYFIDLEVTSDSLSLSKSSLLYLFIYQGIASLYLCLPVCIWGTLSLQL